eukprot:SAG22_NODE_989_length_6137_cov_5.207519_1_plen_222_part_00
MTGGENDHSAAHVLTLGTGMSGLLLAHERLATSLPQLQITGRKAIGTHFDLDRVLHWDDIDVSHRAAVPEASPPRASRCGSATVDGQTGAARPPSGPTAYTAGCTQYCSRQTDSSTALRSQSSSESYRTRTIPVPYGVLILNEYRSGTTSTRTSTGRVRPSKSAGFGQVPGYSNQVHYQVNTYSVPGYRNLVPGRSPLICSSDSTSPWPGSNLVPVPRCPA